MLDTLRPQQCFCIFCHVNKNYRGQIQLDFSIHLMTHLFFVWWEQFFHSDSAPADVIWMFTLILHLEYDDDNNAQN